MTKIPIPPRWQSPDLSWEDQLKDWMMCNPGCGPKVFYWEGAQKWCAYLQYGNNEGNNRGNISDRKETPSDPYCPTAAVEKAWKQYRDSQVPPFEMPTRYVVDESIRVGGDPCRIYTVSNVEYYVWREMGTARVSWGVCRAEDWEVPGADSWRRETPEGALQAAVQMSPR